MDYKKSVVNSFLKNGFNVSILNTDCKSLEICVVSINGRRNTYCMLDKSTIFYYIAKGEGLFVINDENIKVNEKDLIEIPPNNKYSYEGNLEMLEIQSQAFNESEVHEIPRD